MAERLVAFDASDVDERWGVALRDARLRPVNVPADAAVDDRDAVRWIAARDEVVTGRLRYDLEVTAPIDTSDRQLEPVEDGGQEQVQLVEDRRPHQVRDDGENRGCGEQGAVEGDLVDVVEYDVGRIRGRQPAEEERHDEVEVVLVTAAHDAVAVHLLVAGSASKAGSKEGAAMAAAREVAEDLLEMDFGAPSARVLQVPPVEGDDMHAGLLAACGTHAKPGCRLRCSPALWQVTPVTSRPSCPVCDSGDATLRYRLSRFAIWTCGACGQIFLWPQPTEDEIRGLFLTVARRRGWTPFGIDDCAEATRHAREHFGLAVTIGDFEDFARDAQHFDVITMWDIIEHARRPVDLLAAACRCLEPHGVVGLSTPNQRSILDLVAGTLYRLSV